MKSSIALLLLFVAASWAEQGLNSTALPIFTKGNGIFQVEYNGICPLDNIQYPVVTRLWVDGELVIPNLGDGATLQMTSRSSMGNAYNPTQGGDCKGNPSILSGYIPNWSMGLGISPANGLLLGVTPRNWNQQENGEACMGAGAPLPIAFNWGMTMGDGVNFPLQGMILDMGIQRQPGAQVLIKRISELPSAFPFSSILHYAYYSIDGTNYGQITDGQTCDVLAWPNGPVYGLNARIVYLSTSGNPETGWGMAFIGNPAKLVYVGATNRPTPEGNVAAMTMTGAADVNEVITDYASHLKRTVVAVGNLDTIRAVTATAWAKIPNWGDI
eukprot:TRINITY_DN1341_c0_g1_i3.p1 TRINITY_DN1341_c0_g1~~TRINITY_DN1341_c0_g1_i3.p1  ORF type:complete len:328 (+),score=70.89 TRINITY_DN1341_c0_g1_i3:26-1009(+)